MLKGKRTLFSAIAGLLVLNYNALAPYLDLPLITDDIRDYFIGMFGFLTAIFMRLGIKNLKGQ